MLSGDCCIVLLFVYAATSISMPDLNLTIRVQSKTVMRSMNDLNQDDLTAKMK